LVTIIAGLLGGTLELGPMDPLHCSFAIRKSANDSLTLVGISCLLARSRHSLAGSRRAVLPLLIRQ